MKRFYLQNLFDLCHLCSFIFHFYCEIQPPPPPDASIKPLGGLGSFLTFKALKKIWEAFLDTTLIWFHFWLSSHWISLECLNIKLKNLQRVIAPKWFHFYCEIQPSRCFYETAGGGGEGSYLTFKALKNLGSFSWHDSYFISFQSLKSLTVIPSKS